MRREKCASFAEVVFIRIRLSKNGVAKFLAGSADWCSGCLIQKEPPSFTQFLRSRFLSSAPSLLIAFWMR